MVAKSRMGHLLRASAKVMFLDRLCYIREEGLRVRPLWYGHGHSLREKREQ